MARASRRPWWTALPLLCGPWLLWQRREPAPDGTTPPATTPPATTPPATTPTDGRRSLSLDVVIPARDEERALPGLLRSLRAQTRPADVIVVVDDHSSDRTGDVARLGGARVVGPGPLPPGWVGKTWACHHGGGATSGDVVLFLDADVTLAPDAIARLLGEHRRTGGLVSVQPSHRTQAAYEQASAVCNVVAVMGTGAFTGRPRRPARMAFGPCMLVGRHDYDAAGGHAHPDVRGRVTEDIGLARRFAAAGLPVTILGGGGTVSFRMYPDGARQLWDGWTKMLAVGARSTPPIVAVAVAVWVTGALRAAGSGGRVIVAVTRRRWSPEVTTHAVVYALWAAEMRWLFGRVGTWRPWTAACFPAPLVAFVVLVGRSLLLAVRGRPGNWRGRPVPAG